MSAVAAVSTLADDLRAEIGDERVRTGPTELGLYRKDASNMSGSTSVVCLPETTEQVSEILRLCNRTDLMAKPLSTGFHAVCAASRDRVVVLTGAGDL